MKKLVLLLLTIGLVVGCRMSAFAEEVLYDFEGGLQGWQIPDWAYEKDDYVGDEVLVSSEYASSGKQSLKLTVDFPGKRWTGGIVEIMEYMDWTPHKYISCDVFIPPGTPDGLKAKIILTVGDGWKWVEMSRSIKLKAGEWTTISADLTPGSMDWKRLAPTDEFRADVRKIDVRIESNNKPQYKGAIYIDNVRVE